MQTLKRYSAPLLRIAMSLVFIYFGFKQIISPADWTGFVPDIALSFGISALNIVIINSLVELIFGIFMLIGLFTRVSSALLTIHLLVISLSIGFNPLGIRDFGLTIATLAVFLNGPDDFCLDKRYFKAINLN